MKLIYEASDGVQFETEDECVQHEFELSYEDLLPFFANDDIRVWTSHKEKKNLSEFLKKGDLESFFDNVFYIDFKTEKARFALMEFAEKHDIYLGSNYIFPFKSADFYYWNNNEEVWCALSALKGLIASLEEIRNSPSN